MLWTTHFFHNILTNNNKKKNSLTLYPGWRAAAKLSLLLQPARVPLQHEAQEILDEDVPGRLAAAAAGRPEPVLAGHLPPLVVRLNEFNVGQGAALGCLVAPADAPD